MTLNQDPSGKRPKRLTPEELAGEVARRLKLDRGGHRKSSRIDIVTISRIVMGLGVVVLGFGVVFAAKWAIGLAGFETTGTVDQETPIFGCPGEPQAGVLFSGETVELVGRSEDGLWFVVRHPRGPGNMVYADSAAISPAEDPSELRVRTCEPRSDEVVAAALASTTSAAQSSTIDPGVSSTETIPTTTIPGEVTTTARRGRADHARHPVPTTTTTTRPGSPTTTTRPPATTTTRPGTPTTECVIGASADDDKAEVLGVVGLQTEGEETTTTLVETTTTTTETTTTTTTPPTTPPTTAPPTTAPPTTPPTTAPPTTAPPTTRPTTPPTTGC